MVKKVSNNDMSEILKAKKAVIDFSATWCGPCKMLAPVVEELSEEMTDVEFYNVDVDENSELAGQFAVQSVPSLFVVENGEVVNRTVGFQPKAQVKAWIESK